MTKAQCTIAEIRPHNNGVRYFICHPTECGIDVLEDWDENRSYWWTGTDQEVPKDVRQECDELIDNQ